MKTLLLMRHAKSSWKDPELADHERPLNKRGRKDAPFMGEILREKELFPQKILASTALRVRQTIEGLAQSGYSGEVEFLDSYYLAEPEAYLEGLRSLPDTIERAMILAHNPGLESLLQKLTGRIEPLATGSLAYMSLPIQSWAELQEGTEGELVELFNPHELRELKEEEEEEKEKKEKKKEREELNRKGRKERKEEKRKEKKKEKS